MYRITGKTIRFLLALALALGGFALAGRHASAGPVTITLCASDGAITMPDATVVPVWGFVLNPGSCTPGLITALPGPMLEVNQGDVVTVNLASALPVGHTASFEVPGLSVSPTAGGYQFTASRVGTFVYQSDADAGRQMAMGMYGALIVRPTAAAAQFASNACSANPGSVYGNAFDRECLMVLSQVDPAFNANPGGFDMNDYLATYWLINGKAYPDVSLNPLVTGSAGQRLLLRYVNAGYDNTAMILLGAHEQVLARDAFPLNHPFLADAEVIPAGGTEDAIFTVPAGAPPSPNGFPLFNRNLHVTSGSPASAPGGMLTFIKAGVGGPTPTPTPTSLATATPTPPPTATGTAIATATNAPTATGIPTSVPTSTPTSIVVSSTMHVGAMSGVVTNNSPGGPGGGSYTVAVTITVHNASHGLLSGVTVSGTWTTAAGGFTSTTTSCVTNVNGQCSVQAVHNLNPNSTSNNLIYTVNSLSLASYTYVSAGNDVPNNVTVARP